MGGWLIRPPISSPPRASGAVFASAFCDTGKAILGLVGLARVLARPKCNEGKHLASYPKKVIHLNTPRQLLKAKRSSALMDARKMEKQLARLTQSAETAGITTNLRCIVQMFRDHIAALDEAIKSTKLKGC